MRARTDPDSTQDGQGGARGETEVERLLSALLATAAQTFSPGVPLRVGVVVEPGELTAMSRGMAPGGGALAQLPSPRRGAIPWRYTMLRDRRQEGQYLNPKTLAFSVVSWYTVRMPGCGSGGVASENQACRRQWPQPGDHFAHTRREFLGESKRLWRGRLWPGPCGPGETIPDEAGTRYVRCFGIER